MKKRIQVAEEALGHLVAVAGSVLTECPEIVAAYLHGSVARREPAGDVDLAVLLSGASDWRLLEQLAAKIEALGAPAGLEVDLRPLTGTSPRFRANVIREGRLLYERDHVARLEFEARSMSEWLDFQPVWTKMRDHMLERWARG